MAWPNIFYGWWVVIACFIISLYIGSVVFWGFTAFFEPLIQEFNWSYAQVSFAASLRGLEMGVFAPIVGLLVDRYGSRKLIFWGMVTVGLGLIVLSQTHSLATFYAAFILIAFGAGGCTSVVLLVAVANWFQKNVGKAMGITACGFGAAGLIVPLIVRLIDAHGWRTSLVVLGLGTFALGAPVAFVVRDRPEDYGLRPDGEAARRPGDDKERPSPEPDLTFRQAFKTQAFLSVLGVEAIRMMILSGATIHIMPYLSSLGVPRSTAGLIAAGVPLCSIIGRFGFGWLGDICDKRHALAAAFGMMAVGLVLFHYLDTWWVVVVFLVVFPPGMGGTMVLRGAMLREYFGRQAFGRMLGICLGSGALGGIVGPTLAGWVFDTVGHYTYIWHLNVVLSLLAVVLVMKIRR